MRIQVQDRVGMGGGWKGRGRDTGWREVEERSREAWRYGVGMEE